MGEHADDAFDVWLNDQIDDFYEDDEGSFIPRPNPRPYPGPPVTVKGKEIHRTDKAVLWKPPNQEEQWVPIAHIYGVKLDEITISSWIARKKGW